MESCPKADWSPQTARGYRDRGPFGEVWPAPLFFGKVALRVLAGCVR